MERARKGRLRPLATDPAVLAEIDRRFVELEGVALSGDTVAERAGRLAECLKRLPDVMREGAGELEADFD
jgi:hypothetical protein